MGSTKQWVYAFSAQKTEGNKEMKNLLGGKGANLAEMSSLKLPVPPGFTITTEACLDYQTKNKKIDPAIQSEVLENIKIIENLTGKKFGGKEGPLLFSVRSGSRASMPGMMDTVLNLGLNNETVEALAKLTNNPRFAWDSYRRFIQMYSNVVLDLNISILESTLEDMREARGVKEDTGLTADDLRELVGIYKKIILEDFGVSFPTDPFEQLWRAIGAVFESWNNPRAIKYRELHNLDHNWGTAVNVQSMVFGNMGTDCATGVAFTRDPSTGENRFFGEFLSNAQGEDVVAGLRTPWPINKSSINDTNKNFRTLEETMPKVYQELVVIYKKLESHYKDMQDIEFTVEKEKLYILQTRNGKRTAQAALKIATDLVKEGLITKKDALKRIKPDELNQLLHPRLDPNAEKIVLAKGLPASPGAASGMIVFSSEEAQRLNEQGKDTILVRLETSPDDIGGMVSARGILTARGGMTSHAAVVARGMGKPCVAGCSDLYINYAEKTVSVRGRVFKAHDLLTIDGATGEVINGIIPTIKPELSSEFSLFMTWADEVRKLKVRTNADTPEDCEVALNFGAQGIGLCRTEHMFFNPERILAVREMIFAQEKSERLKALKKLLPFQKNDFVGIFSIMKGLPVNIRLLDPPLHEFLPTKESEMQELAQVLGINIEEVKKRSSSLHEFNPMLGHRGCRLGISYPEIYRMQVRAIAEAALEVQSKGMKVLPEIMIPLISGKKELDFVKSEILDEIKDVLTEKKMKLDFMVGTMIELPRAALTASEIAKSAEFFSFGTNDLTQTTFGISRDDSGKFLPDYIARQIWSEDPFVTLDQEGVGTLVKMAVKNGKEANPNLHCGICGEHGGEPQSIDFCHKIGLDYVSCSPFRVPIARLSAAQSNL